MRVQDCNVRDVSYFTRIAFIQSLRHLQLILLVWADFNDDSYYIRIYFTNMSGNSGGLLRIEFVDCIRVEL